jgi:DNA-binding response OmpR family regulator
MKTPNGIAIIVEDEKEMRELVSDFLQERGIQTRAFADAQSAL